ncbi:DUF7507 domain-containing protein [Ruania halotolerans]|uniref:DUF7507 domain-containing protein n=1 Tax=Ruania halotolerans TaxID=2897773 RepID=UPI001E649CEC|nr:DUF11 domain-containing protein [Ruania halotolerans]UFU06218.1 DUF11 domain-containing protein [Ruania halotolerans]
MLALVAASLSTVAPWATTTASAAPGDPFDPADPLVFVGQGQPTGLFRAVTNADGEVEFEAEGTASPVTYNALAYNPADNYLYALVNSVDNTTYPEGSLIRIGEAGVISRVGTETFGRSIIGAMGPDGYYYSATDNGNELSVIDTSTGALVEVIDLDQPVYAVATPGGPDIAFLDGYFWSAGNGGFSRTDPSTGTVTYFPGEVDAALQVAGAAWTFGNGNLGFSFNVSGTVVQFAVDNPDSANPTFTEISRGPGPSSSNNDGASSPGQPTDLSVVKEGPAALVAGSTVEYTITVTNNGPGNSSGFTVSDTIPEPLINPGSTDPNCDVSDRTVTCIGGRTLAGESAEFTITADVPADLAVDAVAENTVTVLANEEDPDPGNNTSTSTGEAAAIDVVKEVAEVTDENNNGLTDAGDTISYQFTVTNTGLVDLTEITVEDPLLEAGALTCPATELAAGANTICTADYTITEDDEGLGEVENTATASGTTPDEQSVSSEPSTTTTPVQVSEPGLSLVKSADPATDEFFTPGQEITYTFVVTNTGNVPIEDIAIEETAFTGSGELPAPVCESITLAPGAQTSCATVYTLTEDDIVAGSVANEASATGTPPGEEPIGSPPSEVEIPTPAEPGLSLTKTATPDEASAAGDAIEYSFLVENTGNVTIGDLTIDETEFTGSGELSALTCPATSLAPGQIITCTADYVLTQADVDAGGVSNTATATGTPTGGEPISSEPSTEIVEVEQIGELEMTKTATPDSATAAGEEITYSFLVENTGNITLSDLEVVDVAFTGTGDPIDIVCPDGVVAELAPGDSFVCEATYVVTQADMDAGSIDNAAGVLGTPPDGGTIFSNLSEETVTLEQAPGLTVTKSADPDDVESFVVDQEITYSFLVENTGNVTLTDVEVIEGAFTGSGELGLVTCPDGAGESLAPGETFVCEAAYTLTQEDIDAGSVENTATATGFPPGEEAPIESPPGTTTIPTPADPSLTVTKTASTDSIEAAGEEITYSFLVENTGNVTLTDVAVVEGEFTGAGELGAVTCPDGAASLAPGAQITCTATYEVVAADLDGDEISNTAWAEGTAAGGDTVQSPEDGVTVAVDADSAELPTTGVTILSVLGIAGLLTAAGVSLGAVRRRLA